MGCAPRKRTVASWTPVQKVHVTKAEFKLHRVCLARSDQDVASVAPAPGGAVWVTGVHHREPDEVFPQGPASALARTTGGREGDVGGTELLVMVRLPPRDCSLHHHTRMWNHEACMLACEGMAMSFEK